MFSTPTNSDRPWRRLIARTVHLDPELVDMLDAGRPILITARISTPNASATTREDTLDDLNEAAKTLLDRTGIDVAPLIPDEAELHRRLQHAHPIRQQGVDGKKLEHRFVVIDNTADRGVVVMAATGTGKGLTVDNRQPIVEFLLPLVRQHSPAILASSRQDRLVRNEDGFGPLGAELRRTRTRLCSREFDLKPYDETSMWQMLAVNSASRDEAEKFVSKSRKGQVAHSGRQVAPGQWTYQASTAAPPGMDIGVIEAATAKQRQRVIFVDCDEFRPAGATGTSAVPRADEPDRLVDQAANVTFALTHLGRPGWTRSAVCRALIERRFSTDQMRKTNGDASHWVQTYRNAMAVMTTMLSNLDFYQTGILNRPIGYGESVIIDNVFPPSGQWASPSDFDRLRDWLRQSQLRQARNVRLPFVTLPVLFNGEPCLMRTETRRRTTMGHRYKFVRDNGDPDELRVASVGHAPLPVEPLHDSVRDALISAGENGVDIRPLELPHFEPVRSPLDDEVRQIEEEADHLRRTKQTLRSRVTDPALVGALLEDLQADYNAAAARLVELDERVADLRGRIAAQSPAEPQAVPVSALGTLMAALRTSTTLEARDLWLHTLHNVTFRSDQQDPRPQRLWWSGEIVLEAPSPNDRVTIPFNGSIDLDDWAARRKAGNSSASGRQRRPDRHCDD